MLDDGALKCWGVNNHGQLGQGDTAQRGYAPGQMATRCRRWISPPAGPLRVFAARAVHNCALFEGGGSPAGDRTTPGSSARATRPAAATSRMSSGRCRPSTSAASDPPVRLSRSPGSRAGWRCLCDNICCPALSPAGQRAPSRIARRSVEACVLPRPCRRAAAGTSAALPSGAPRRATHDRIGRTTDLDDRPGHARR